MDKFYVIIAEAVKGLKDMVVGVYAIYLTDHKTHFATLEYLMMFMIFTSAIFFTYKAYALCEKHKAIHNKKGN